MGIVESAEIRIRQGSSSSGKPYIKSCKKPLYLWKIAILYAMIMGKIRKETWNGCTYLHFLIGREQQRDDLRAVPGNRIWEREA